jgi:hypothetical protein
MDRQDFQILDELLGVFEQLGRRFGNDSERGPRSSSHRLRKDLASFADNCRQGQLKGRARKRKSGELFRRILALNPDLWDA